MKGVLEIEGVEAYKTYLFDALKRALAGQDQIFSQLHDDINRTETPSAAVKLIKDFYQIDESAQINALSRPAQQINAKRSRFENMPT